MGLDCSPLIKYIQHFEHCNKETPLRNIRKKINVYISTRLFKTTTVVIQS